jgi:E3 ubiquitin-protein ligase HECTD1
LPLDGAIALLKRRCGGNVIDKGVIVAGPGSNSRSAFDFQNSSSLYCHNQSGEQWLSIDFKQMRIYPTDYSIRPRGDRCNPRSWILEGSSDGSTWFTLDVRADQEQLRRRTEVFSFSVSTPRLCQHLRLRKIAAFHDSCTYLELTAIEFYGFIFGCS